MAALPYQHSSCTPPPCAHLARQQQPQQALGQRLAALLGGGQLGLREGCGGPASAGSMPPLRGSPCAPGLPADFLPSPRPSARQLLRGLCLSARGVRQLRVPGRTSPAPPRPCSWRLGLGPVRPQGPGAGGLLPSGAAPAAPGCCSRGSGCPPLRPAATSPTACPGMGQAPEQRRRGVGHMKGGAVRHGPGGPQQGRGGRRRQLQRRRRLGMLLPQPRAAAPSLRERSGVHAGSPGHCSP
jgi:hypothetical protein